jgi:hypothetical protein
MKLIAGSSAPTLGSFGLGPSMVLALQLPAAVQIRSQSICLPFIEQFAGSKIERALRR